MSKRIAPSISRFNARIRECKIRRASSRSLRNSCFCYDFLSLCYSISPPRFARVETESREFAPKLPGRSVRRLLAARFAPFSFSIDRDRTDRLASIRDEPLSLAVDCGISRPETPCSRHPLTFIGARLSSFPSRSIPQAIAPVRFSLTARCTRTPLHKLDVCDGRRRRRSHFRFGISSRLHAALYEYTCAHMRMRVYLSDAYSLANQGECG